MFFELHEMSLRLLLALGAAGAASASASASALGSAPASASVSAASAPLYVVHALSAAHRRPAAWARTLCGSPSKTPQSDIITQWGAAITPDSVATAFGYPRPQMMRPDATHTSLSGLWEFELASGFDDALPVGRTLNQTILVPFPLEACLSGAFRWPAYSMHMFYRIMFDAPAASGGGARTLLHFGAVDYNSTVYLNGAALGAPHLGGYDGFSYDLGVVGAPGALRAQGNELILRVFDPSDSGVQVHGKQKIGAINGPGGDEYTPSSGIWQEAWLESVPAGVHVSELRLRGSATHLFATVSLGSPGTPALVNGTISFDGALVATFSGAAGEELVVPIPAPQRLWAPSTPNLYDLAITVLEPSTGSADTVSSYFGMREVSLLPYTIPGTGGAGSRLGINGNFTFLAGWLDQSWWPDGEYTAPGDDALRFDVQGVLDFGMNFVRLHQKVNPERWYYWADKLGVVVAQDMVQKYGGASNGTVQPFLTELKRMMDGRYNHPSIVQWTMFNEQDCYGVFNVTEVVEWAQAYDSSRLIDADSGGGANGLGVGDVNDMHVRNAHRSARSQTIATLTSTFRSHTRGPARPSRRQRSTQWSASSAESAPSSRAASGRPAAASRTCLILTRATRAPPTSRWPRCCWRRSASSASPSSRRSRTWRTSVGPRAISRARAARHLAHRLRAFLRAQATASTRWTA